MLRGKLSSLLDRHKDIKQNEDEVEPRVNKKTKDKKDEKKGKK